MDATVDSTNLDTIGKRIRMWKKLDSETSMSSTDSLSKLVKHAFINVYMNAFINVYE